ncbi:UNVERIFIED_CONTAM: putative mitochondrial protein [Sesamum latifolium]|uniref:Mitochondrial protein n=1 Tax=Sesamum latifolium TaxID=2727402 RepID=A0AAW2VVI1_9LAMI
MGSNQVWTRVDPPKGARPVGCKWVYKRKLGADGEVTAFKARLVAKGYTQQLGVNFEDTYSPVAMAKSIRILLAIAAWYDYEIWQMDVKTAFLNGFVEEEIFMDQPEGFTAVGEEQKVCHLQRSIYGLKQASRSWNTRFDEVIRGYDFIKNDYDPCIYKKVSGSSVAYLVLYIDDILLIGNDVKMLGDIKAWLCTQFSMKDIYVGCQVCPEKKPSPGRFPQQFGLLGRHGSFTVRSPNRPRLLLSTKIEPYQQQKLKLI